MQRDDDKKVVHFTATHRMKRTSASRPVTTDESRVLALRRACAMTANAHRCNTDDGGTDDRGAYEPPAFLTSYHFDLAALSRWRDG